MAAVREFLQAGASPQAPGGANSVSALHIAVSLGNVEVAQSLIAAGADVNLQDSTGLTPMMLAAHQGNIELVQSLLRAGGDVDLQDFSGTTALMLAQGHREVVETLLRAGANVNAKTESGMTALMFASDSGNIDCVRQCLAAGADIHERDNRGWSAIEFARHRRKRQAGPWCGSLLIFGRLSGSSDTIVQLLQAHIEIPDSALRAPKAARAGSAV